MIAEQCVDLSARIARLFLKCHGEFQAIDAGRAAVEEVADQPQVTVPARPVLRPVTETIRFEQIAVLIEVAVKIANDESRHQSHCVGNGAYFT